MKLLFVHQYSPDQFKHMAPRFAAAAGNQVVFITYSSPARENQPWREFARSSAGRHFNRPTPLIAICA